VRQEDNMTRNANQPATPAATIVELVWPEDTVHEDAAEHSDLARRVVARLEAKGAEVEEVRVEPWYTTDRTYRPGGRAKNWTHKVRARHCAIFAYINGEEVLVDVTVHRLGANGEIRWPQITVGACHWITLEGNVWSDNRSHWQARSYSRGHVVPSVLEESPEGKAARAALGM
jgi:hypothetical protein